MSLARYRALIDLERRYNGPIPPWEREAAIRAARGELENLEHDLASACWDKERFWDSHVRPHAREAMLVHRRRRATRDPVEAAALLRHWAQLREDLRFYLREWTAKRDRVRALEERLTTLAAQATDRKAAE